jgi:putative tryptophan/tyrosine transport system substrate-binding protein
MMRRREFIVGLGGAAIVWPLAARAQQRPMPVIGFLGSSFSPEQVREGFTAFRRALAETGYVEGRNVAFAYRSAEEHNDRLPALAADLVRRQVAVIVTTNTAATLAAKEATQTIPIVFSVGVDPVEVGFVESLNRPGGNLTGSAILNVEVAAKRLEFLHELVPAVGLIAVLVNPAAPASTEAEAGKQQVAARVFGVRLLILNARSQSDIESAFATLVRERAGALVLSSDTFFLLQQDQIVALAARHAIPAISAYREFTAAGGLMAYGSPHTDTGRVVGNYTGRILKGEKPADLPVQRARLNQLFINMKTAKALGLTFPRTLLGRSDEVFE